MTTCVAARGSGDQALAEENRMSIFAIADLHLGEAVDKPMDLFGRRWKNHKKRLEKAWREEVGAEDVVLIGGDISWAINLAEVLPDLQFIESLPGEKVLLRGNHDYWWPTMSKLRNFALDHGLGSLRFLQNNALPIAENYVLAGSRGWMLPDDPRFSGGDQKILERETQRLGLSLGEAAIWQREGRQLLVLCHYPPFERRRDSSVLTRMIGEAGARLCCYGHIHQDNSPYCLSEYLLDGVPYHLVAADYLAFRPRRLSLPPPALSLEK